MTYLFDPQLTRWSEDISVSPHSGHLFNSVLDGIRNGLNRQALQSIIDRKAKNWVKNYGLLLAKDYMPEVYMTMHEVLNEK
jgi:hypothetical protein